MDSLTQVEKGLLPMNFQSGLDALQDHRPHSFHQRGKVFGDNPKVLSFTSLHGRHKDNLRLWVKARPAPLQIPDHMILYFFDFFLWHLVPLVAHEQSTFGW